MAESFASHFADLLLRKLASNACEEASRAYGVFEDLYGIKRTLSIVRDVLPDAEERKDQTYAFRKWLRQVQNILYDAEDVLEKFELEDKRKQVVKAYGSTAMKVGSLFSSSNPQLVFRLRIACEIKEIRHKLDKVASEREKFGLLIGLEQIKQIKKDASTVFGRDKEEIKQIKRKMAREMTNSYVDASSVIGRENDREKIINLLTQSHPDGDGDESLGVIPIVGIGGSGKTTLAKLVFNDKRIDDLFELKMWVCMSGDSDIRQIVIKIIISASSASTFALASPLVHQKNINNLDDEQLRSCLRDTLFNQKFLLVLDDEWNEHREKWIGLKQHLIKLGASGSKIMVTTRSTLIASMMGTIPSYVLDGLSPENRLSLFVKHAFKKGEEQEYPHLVEIGKEIIKKSRGVPLAVITLGSFLSSTLELEIWEYVRECDIWNLQQVEDDILPELKLSYDQMPSYLKQCFTYFSLYPKDFTFNSDEITSLWVAFGLVHSRNESEKLEDIARGYIDELNSRSFLEDFIDYGYYCTFKVNCLMHCLALYVSKEEFVVVNSRTLNIPEQARHISIVENVSLGHAFFPKSKSVRTILFPSGGVGLDSESLLDIWISRYKYLRVLDLSKSSFETLPNSIAKLEYLRILDLSCNRKIKRLPHSICKLQNLQVLSLNGCKKLETMPKGLRKLISLRQLFITTKHHVLSLDEFASLNHLRALNFCWCDNLKLSFSGQQQLTSLETLIIQSCGSLEYLPLYIFPRLQTLFIADCAMLSLSLKNESPVQRLMMKHLHLVDFSGLQTLPRWIKGATNTLETLIIYNFPNLKRLPKCLKVMTHLKRLHLVECPQLSSLPSDMHRLIALEDLVIDGCPELCGKCQPQSGEYWPMIAHIKSIFIGKPR